MNQALDEQVSDTELRDALKQALSRTADHMINKG
jgi:truncated hemoglobin YjbI